MIVNLRLLLGEQNKDCKMPSKEYYDERIMSANPIVDTRKGDRHKPRKRKVKSGKQLSKWDRRKVVAWDGEGANLESGEHIYNLLANSEGTRVYHEGGLSTEECLDFFITYGDPKAINVIYGGSYDVNMILKDVPIELLANLWANGDCFWKSYRIFYAPRKKLTVQKFSRTPGRGGKYDKITFTLWDVIGFYQSTFVNACRRWLGDLPVLDEIDLMKQQRSVFREADKAEIIEYNRKECELLVMLMGALFDALDDAGIRLIRYDGAGSIASAQLRKHGVLEHKGEPNEEVIMWARHAYSGGRIEAVKVGNEERPIYRYDINSAYPASCLALPSYKGASWETSYGWDKQDCSMVHIRWTFTEDKRKRKPFHPLWFREYDGSILYPSMGEGIYWGVEVNAAIECLGLELVDKDAKYWHTYKGKQGSIVIEGACNVKLANDIKPFSYLEDMYASRLLLKRAGNMANEAFKLGMNSTYGKLAQQAGYRNGRIPTYHQLLWAGQITATSRAQLYRAAMQKPKSVIAFATDAVITTDPLDLNIGEGLGEWTHDKFTGITIVQPGVYWLQEDDEWAAKYRGFDKGSLHRDYIIGCWLFGFDYEATLTRFVGMGSALASNDFYSHWRKWETNPRSLSLIPSGKREPSDDVCYWDHLCDTLPTPNVHDLMSMPYPLLWDEGSDIKLYKESGDLSRLIEEEDLDSYA
jgi:hypothetical protein